jgi:hypothetical protein
MIIEEKSEIVPLRNMNKTPNASNTNSIIIIPIPLYLSFTCCQKINKTNRHISMERKYEKNNVLKSICIAIY